MNWTYQNKDINCIEDFGEPTPYGFAYIINNINTGAFYVGRKILQNNIKRKIGKREREREGIRNRIERIQKESNWKTYYGSNQLLIEHVKTQGEDNFKREILQLAFSKKQLTYLETKYQFTLNVLEDPLSMNDTILGKFYKKDFNQ